MKQIAKKTLEKDGKGSHPEQELVAADPEQALAPPDFIKIEKNLSSLGFFTPSSKKIKNAKAKTITFTRLVDGRKLEARVTIAPAALYGLPITADQDKYLALQKIITDLRQQVGEIRNPIGFTSADLLRLLGKRVRTGKNYDDITEWLKRMTLTGIISEGVVYFAGRKSWATDTFHVFERSVSIGQELPGGGVADKNYIWLSEWQLENINNNHLLPIDYETYKRLKNHIAKALVPLLQIWLYATREDGYFEKRYDELCQHLDIREYHHPSKIKEKLGPALNELKAHSYITDWKVEDTSDKKGYKIVFYHGEKFHRDHRRRLAQKGQTAIAARQRLDGENGTWQPGREPDPALVAELTKRGIADHQARKLLLDVSQTQYMIDQLEWGDYLIAQSAPGKFYNPAGFYVHLIKENIIPPDSFESNRKKRLSKEAREAQSRANEEEARLELAYEEYRKRELKNHISTNYSEDEYRRLFEVKKKELLRQYKKQLSNWDESTLNKLVESAIDSYIAKIIPLLGFDEFCEQHREQPSLF
jgi:hypothetical protein